MDPVWLTAIGTILLALFTFLLAIVAVFQDYLRTCVFKPKLHIFFSFDDCRKVPINLYDGKGQFLDSADSYYFQIRVKNEGKNTAENVEVILDRIEKQDGNKFLEVPYFLPFNLTWAYYPGTPWFGKIPPDITRLCTLGHIVKPVDRSKCPQEYDERFSKDKTIFHLETSTPTTAKSHLIGPGTYKLHLIVVAANAKKSKRTLKLTLTGKWDDCPQIMMKEGINIQEIDSSE